MIGSTRPDNPMILFQRPMVIPEHRLLFIIKKAGHGKVMITCQDAWSVMKLILAEVTSADHLFLEHLQGTHLSQKSPV